MGPASCASKALPCSKATTIIRKPPGGLLLKMASTARPISCDLIPPQESTATSNVRAGREEKDTMESIQGTMGNKQWTFSCLVLLGAKQRYSVMGIGSRRSSQTYLWEVERT